MKNKEHLYTEAEYKEIRNLWDDFKEEIKYKNRFFAGHKIITILDKMKKIGEERECTDSLAITLKPNEDDLTLYRARIGDYTDEEKYEEKKLLNPPSSLAKAGRCNPMGVSYLYLSNNIKTAIHEIRPNIGDMVTVAEISVKPKEIISFHLLNKVNDIYDNNQLKSYDVEALVDIINKDLSSVITVNQDMDYLPYQFLAEYIKNRGFDCFSFESSITDGVNYVIFDSKKATVQSRYLYKINQITCQYEEV